MDGSLNFEATQFNFDNPLRKYEDFAFIPKGQLSLYRSLCAKHNLELGVIYQEGDVYGYDTGKAFHWGPVPEGQIYVRLLGIRKDFDAFKKENSIEFNSIYS